MSAGYDFSGWATRYNVHCDDGRTLLPNAFKDDDGKTVPLVWAHSNEPERVLGKAVLHHCAEGMRADCVFNNTDAGKLGKELVTSGSITGLSIRANRLVHDGANVLRGKIRELSLVLSGANDGAYIDEVFAHGDDEDPVSNIYMCEAEFEPYRDEIEHESKNGEEEKKMADEKKPETKEKTVGDVLNDIESKLSEEEMNVVYGLIGTAAEGAEKDSDEGEEDGNMKHNAFEGGAQQSADILTHSDEMSIIELSKKVGSFKDALEIYREDNELTHDGAAPVGGFTQDTKKDGNISWLFPDYKDLKTGEPELITDDWSWQSKVLSKVHKLPFSRVRTGQVDIRKLDALRAKGYEKGKFKTYSGNFQLARRTTDPQTVYVKNALHKDDITDITDFDYVNYLYKIDRQMLINELATAILFGDGRDEDDENKIFPDHIRPIWTDDDLYTLKGTLDLAAAKEAIQGSDTSKHFSDNYILSEAFIEKLLYMREKFKGTGQPDLYITPHMINVMLLSRDLNGRRIYSSIEELRSALNVNSIITVEQMADQKRTKDGKTYQLDALVANLSDYAVGSTKGGEVVHHTQFDIHYNQELSLIETRVSGALTRPWSAIAIEEEVTSNDVNPVG